MQNDGYRKQQEVVCFYHKNCIDGLGAAYAISKRFPQAACFPIQYGEAITADLKGKLVIVVDFSFTLEKTLEIIDQAAEFIILDHHASFKPVYQELEAKRLNDYFGDKPVKFIYDEERSGALLAWEYFHADKDVHPLTWTISDGDLWRFEFPETRTIMAAVGMIPYSLDAYTRLFENFEHLRGQLMEEGAVLLRKNLQDARNIIRTSVRDIRVGKHIVPLINCPYYLASDALAILAREHPYAVSYFDTKDERVFSIRSAPSSEHDVSIIAEEYGGGGHKHAAGWRAPRYSSLAQL